MLPRGVKGTYIYITKLMHLQRIKRFAVNKLLICFEFYFIYLFSYFVDLVLLVDNTALNSCYLPLFDFTKNM